LLYLILMALAFACAVLAALGFGAPWPNPPLRFHLGWVAVALAILAVLLSGTGIK
jgi:hypothetical protein